MSASSCQTMSVDAATAALAAATAALAAAKADLADTAALVTALRGLRGLSNDKFVIAVRALLDTESSESTKSSKSTKSAKSAKASKASRASADNIAIRNAPSTEQVAANIANLLIKYGETSGADFPAKYRTDFGHPIPCKKGGLTPLLTSVPGVESIPYHKGVGPNSFRYTAPGECPPRTEEDVKSTVKSTAKIIRHEIAKTAALTRKWGDEDVVPDAPTKSRTTNGDAASAVKKLAEPVTDMASALAAQDAICKELGR